MDLKVAQGQSISLPADFASGGQPADPVDPLVEITTPDGTTVVTGGVPVRESIGIYRYDYKVSSDAPAGIWKATWTARMNGRHVSGSDEFRVLPAAPAPKRESAVPIPAGKAVVSPSRPASEPKSNHVPSTGFS